MSYSSIFVSDIVIDHATKNDIRTVILEKPVNPISSFVEGAYNVFSFLLVPFIILSIIRTFSMTSNMGAGPLGPRDTFHGPLTVQLSVYINETSTVSSED